MPLPPALLARLQKRGLVKKSEAETGPEEEVIAEDYDDHNRTEEDDFEDSKVPSSQQPKSVHKAYDPKRPAPYCPNKYSIFHICSPYCFENWLPRQPSPNTERKRKLMLNKYPLPNDWQECFDSGIGRHYYWNTITDEVSWLPPDHPRCKISLPAVKLRAIVKAAEKEEKEEDENTSDEEDEPIVESNSKKDRQLQRRGYHPSNRTPRGGSKREPELDPMDPASYGECGRGTWSTGLARKGEAKTGADTTASGPLYQMRPYPSPGAILRMNAENSKPPPSK